MFRFRDIIDAKLIIPNGSDCPVEPPNPFFGMHAAIARTDRQNNPDGGYEIEQGMNRLEALYSYSLWAAYGQFEEESKGSLTIGKCADFIVIDKDYFGCMIDEIKDIKVLETWVDGELVFEAPKL